MRRYIVSLAIWSAWLLMAIKMEELKVTQPKFLMANSSDSTGTITMVCGYIFTGTLSEEFRITIYKGRIVKEAEVCVASFNSSMLPFEKNQTFHCLGKPSADKVSITLSGLNMLDTNMYYCKVTKMHPPPIINSIGNGTVFYIQAKEDYCKENCTSGETVKQEPGNCNEFTQATVIVLVLLLVFLLYSIVITCAHCMMKASEEQSSEYVNMDPAIQNSRRQWMNSAYRT
ncbi:CD28 molecule isoform X3 [Callorhinchus milii]|uniref:CD28 molecule n=1 Tax=Callorhinchus milii TaxID=7868 RepID=K4FU79_CALMI|nr:CD28 molecule isoform X3 [Callorhinchus milii]AFK11430.1 cytotoxic T-lymphocyte protein 4-like protein [Callorhinchus milii]|eukprot:gi/632946912/ref/XP_007888795.1/ PREDICTED: T-cell-specific surface glycoprotein CD28 homolog isoform X2 [Callorhinchus milii]